MHVEMYLKFLELQQAAMPAGRKHLPKCFVALLKNFELPDFVGFATYVGAMYEAGDM